MRGAKVLAGLGMLAMVAVLAPPAEAGGAPQVQISKSVEESTMVVGGTLHFHITVESVGGVTANDVVVTDPNAPDCNRNLGVMPISTTIRYECVKRANFGDLGTNFNTATADGSNTSPATSNTVSYTVDDQGLSHIVFESGDGDLIPGAFVLAFDAGTGEFIRGSIASTSAAEYGMSLPPGNYNLWSVDVNDHYFQRVTGPFTVEPDEVLGAAQNLTAETGEIAGSVDREGGINVPDARVGILDAATGEPVRIVPVDANAEFRIEGLPPGNYRLYAFNDANSVIPEFWSDTTDPNASTTVAVTAGNTTTTDLALTSEDPGPRALSIGGNVTRSSGGNLAGIWAIALNTANFRYEGIAVTDAGGNYSIPVRAGNYRVEFIDPTFNHRLEWYDNLPFTSVSSATPVTAPGVNINAALDRLTGTVSGTVFQDGGSTRVPFASVILLGPNSVTRGTRADHIGNYSISGLPPGQYRAVFFHNTGSHEYEFHDNSPDFANSDPVTVTADTTTSLNASLAVDPTP